MKSLRMFLLTIIGVFMFCITTHSAELIKPIINQGMISQLSTEDQKRGNLYKAIISNNLKDIGNQPIVLDYALGYMNSNPGLFPIIDENLLKTSSLPRVFTRIMGTVLSTLPDTLYSVVMIQDQDKNLWTYETIGQIINVNKGDFVNAAGIPIAVLYYPRYNGSSIIIVGGYLINQSR